MNHKPTQTILTTLTLILAVLQAPYLYYYADGLFGVIIVIPYFLTGLSLSVFLWLSYRKYSKVKSRYNFIALRVAMCIGVASLVVGSEAVQWMDWHLRLAERNRLVYEVKAGRLRPNVTHNDFICKLPHEYFPPISNGGNEISIRHRTPHISSIEFYIDRGFLDNYSAFLYTNDPEEMSGLDSTIKAGNQRLFRYSRLAPNWYKIAH